ncbi:MAG: hypothetical protein AMS21_00780 [Gemmatimonas sp. SG8_38_2]|nr:MAG: hypothetical protein AMS21_00780 [Gemmatimonas sp. SG8_38_2]
MAYPTVLGYETFAGERPPDQFMGAEGDVDLEFFGLSGVDEVDEEYINELGEVIFKLREQHPDLGFKFLKKIFKAPVKLIREAGRTVRKVGKIALPIIATTGIGTGAVGKMLGRRFASKTVVGRLLSKGVPGMLQKERRPGKTVVMTEAGERIEVEGEELDIESGSAVGKSTGWSQNLLKSFGKTMETSLMAQAAASNPNAYRLFQLNTQITRERDPEKRAKLQEQMNTLLIDLQRKDKTARQPGTESAQTTGTSKKAYTMDDVKMMLSEELTKVRRTFEQSQGEARRTSSGGFPFQPKDEKEKEAPPPAAPPAFAISPTVIIVIVVAMMMMFMMRK